MRLGKTIKSALGKDIPPELMEVAKRGDIDLLLSGDSENMLDDMISKGVFKDKSDFISFLVREYARNDMGSMLSGDRMPPESTIMDIIRRSGLDMGYRDTDVKKMLVPLLVTAFYAIYRYMSKMRAMKPA
jgi:hypothetical protein